MSTPRLVLVHRPTQLKELLAEHGTLGAVEFFLSSRGQGSASLVAADAAQMRALDQAASLVPADWRLAVVERAQLSRFLFEPDDLIAIVGQDGLVPNVSKYLTGQPVVGINPLGPSELCSFTVADLGRLVTGAESLRIAPRAMVEAKLDDGQILTALNEVFVGDRGHQSARYELKHGDAREMQSSSGLIVGTGTGATGWLASLWQQSRPSFQLPASHSEALAYFVREAWPSESTGTELIAGILNVGDELVVQARGPLVIFGDGIEKDCLRLGWGQVVRLCRAAKQLNLATVSTTSSSGSVK